MTKADVYEFIRAQSLGVVSSTGPDGTPQSALVGIAVTPALEIIFDTLEQSRKAQNLCRNPACSMVIGWAGEITVQMEGLAARYQAADEFPSKEIYFQKWPECREHLKWPGITYFVVSPAWIRYSDYNRSPAGIVEFMF